MVQRFRFKYIIIGLLQLLSGWSVQLRADNVSVRLDPSVTYQTVEGIGGGIVYYLDWVTTHKNKAIVYDTIFTGLGISGLRIANWAQEDTADLKHEKEIMAEARKRLGKKFFTLMSCWSAPAYLKANNSLRGTGSGSVKASLKKQDGKFMYNEYGKWWRKSIERYQAVGISPDYVSIQNEPDMDATYEATLFNPTESWDVASYGAALSAVANNFNGLSPRPKLIGPEVMGIGWQQTQKYVWELDQNLLGGYCFHYYHSGLNDHDALDLRYSYPDDFTDAMKGLFTDYGYSKPMFMTENSSLRERQQNDPVLMAWFISKAFNENRVASYLHWNLLWGNEGDGCINLDFDEQGYNSESGYVIQGDYHALRHYTKYVQRGWKVFSSSTNNRDILATAFKSPSNDAYTLVIVNKGQKWHNVSHNLSLTGFQMEVVQSIPANGVWSSPITDFSNGLNVAPNSIVTIAYRKNPDLCIWGENGDGIWSEADKWSGGKVPSEWDYVQIKSGVCAVKDLFHTSEIVVHEGAELNINEISIANDLKVYKGLLSLNSGPNNISLRGLITTIDTATILVDEDAYTLLLSGELKGNGEIIKRGKGKLLLESEAKNFSGSWKVDGGILENSINKAFGYRPIYVSNGAHLSILYEDSIVALELERGGTVRLNSDLRVREAVIADSVLANGTYTAEDFPGLLEGDAKLIVYYPYPALDKWGDGAISQVVMEGTKIVPFYFSYANVSDIRVEWNPYQPIGVNVTFDGSEQDRYISVSGTLKEEGLFKYTVVAMGYKDSTITVEGLISTPAAITTDLADSYSDSQLQIKLSSTETGVFAELSQSISSSVDYTILDLQGREIYGGRIESDDNLRHPLNFNFSLKGLYIFSWLSDDANGAVRFVVE